MTTFYRSLIASLLLASVGAGLHAEPVDAFLKKARAHLGPESTLEGVETISYHGVVMSPTGEKLSDLVLYFDAPNRQLLQEKRENVINQTAVNGYEGYVMSKDPTDPKKEIIQVLRPIQTKRLMFNAIENLNFFEGAEKIRGGEIIDEGVVDYNGKPARKIRFNYPFELYYVRYFNPDSGELLATISSDGLTMVEQHKIQAGGITFPKTVDTYDETGALLRTVEFTEIKVNEQLQPGLFDFPE